MAQDDGFHHWINELAAGTNEAVEQLWDDYFQRLVELARKRLPSGGRRDFDEEDVALSAIHSFCKGLGKRRFPTLNDEGNLWALLVLITSRKASHRVRDGQAQKRGGGRVQGESAFGGTSKGGIESVIAENPSAEFAHRLFEETDHLFHVLDDDGLQQIAMLKMEGLTNREVAERLGCVERTVDRRLRLIREIWTASAVETDSES